MSSDNIQIKLSNSSIVTIPRSKIEISELLKNEILDTEQDNEDEIDFSHDINQKLFEIIFKEKSIPPKFRNLESLIEIINLMTYLLIKEDNELYIHIRGGDTFNQGIMLLQNPLKLYTDILQDPSYDTYTRIIVVYEDTRNPVVQALQDIHNPRLHFQSSSIKTDIETLCRAKHLLMSLSTFSLLIYFLSSNIQHILLPEFMEQEWYPNMKWNVDKTLFTLEKYSISTWKYLNPYQKNQLLLHYKGTITKNKCMYVKKIC